MIFENAYFKMIEKSEDLQIKKALQSAISEQAICKNNFASFFAFIIARQYMYVNY
jgi:hypothetical protein